MKKQLNKTIRRSGMWVPLQRWDRLEECDHFCHVVWIWNLQEFYAKCITFTHALRNWYSKVKWFIFQLVMFYDDTHYFFHRSLDYNWRQIYEIGWYIYMSIMSNLSTTTTTKTLLVSHVHLVLLGIFRIYERIDWIKRRNMKTMNWRIILVSDKLSVMIRSWSLRSVQVSMRIFGDQKGL